MKRSQRLRIAWPSAVLAAVLLWPVRPAVAKAMDYYDFEKTTKPWASGAPAGSKVTPLALHGGENGCPSVFDTLHALAQFQTEPGKASGAWIVASFPSTGADLVRLSWSAKGSKLCPNCKAM